VMSKLDELLDYHVRESRSDGPNWFCQAEFVCIFEPWRQYCFSMVALGELKLSHSSSHPKLLGRQTSLSFLYFYCTWEMVAGSRITFVLVFFLVTEIIHRDRGTVLGLVQIVKLIGPNKVNT